MCRDICTRVNTHMHVEVRECVHVYRRAYVCVLCVHTGVVCTSVARECGVCVCHVHALFVCAHTCVHVCERVCNVNVHVSGIVCPELTPGAWGGKQQQDLFPPRYSHSHDELSSCISERPLWTFPIPSLSQALRSSCQFCQWSGLPRPSTATLTLHSRRIWSEPFCAFSGQGTFIPCPF